MIDWFVHTLRELSGNRHLPFPGPRLLFRLFYLQRPWPRRGDRDADCAVIIGQLGITVSGPLKPTFS